MPVGVYIRTKEHIEHLASSLRGKSRTPEFCERMRQIKLGTPSKRKGKHYPEHAGTNHPQYIHGPSYCIDCGKAIKYGASRCRECDDKTKVGKHISQETEFHKGNKPAKPFLKGHGMNKGENNPRYGKGYLEVGENNPNWKGGPTKCVDCGRMFRGRKWPDSRCRECWVKFAQGFNSHAWRGGISHLPYPFEFIEGNIRSEIRERDNHVCQLCGVEETKCETRLTVHHIDYDKMNLDKSNLIALCRSCNSKVNTNRNGWTQYFNDKIVQLYGTTIVI